MQEVRLSTNEIYQGTMQGVRLSINEMYEGHHAGSETVH